MEEKINEQPEDSKQPDNQEAQAPEVKAEEAKAPEVKAEEGQAAETEKEEAKASAGQDAKQRGQQRNKKPYDKQKKNGQNDSQDESAESEFIEKVIAINRITKVTKGGKKLSFSALVVVGDTKGNVGYSLSKAREVATAIRKAMGVAKRNMIAVPMRGTTITHEIIGECSGARVLLKPASDGTGVIASSPVRAVCDGAGIHNILTKCHRSNNPINVVKATIDGLSRLKTINKVS